MSVPIIENWSKISAKIVDIVVSPEITGYSKVEMLVQSVSSINDFPSLLDDTAGENLVVHFPSELVETKALEAGQHLTCWVRKAGLSRCFVHREHVTRINRGGATNKANYS